MKLARITMKQCSQLRELEPDDYLGTKISGSPNRIEHIVISKRRIHTIRKKCSECILSKLAMATYVIGTPVIKPDRTIVFTIAINKKTMSIINQHKERLVNIEEIDYRKIYLTEKQKKAIKLLASGEASNITRLADKLNISKPAAHKLVKKTIHKLAGKHV